MKDGNFNNWLNIGASVIGNGHITNGTPCQDAHFTSPLNQNWGIAVVSDGAGSHENSHLGSAFVVKDAAQVFTELLKGEKWIEEISFPSASDWRDIAITGFSFVYDNLKSYAKSENVDFRSLSCTIILAIYCEKGMVTAHIGDGRAAIMNESGQWQSVMSPFKGEEVGSTVFLPSAYTWEEPSCCIETRVFSKPIRAFALLTDGLETYSFYCYMKRENEEFYYDPNEPYSEFFNQNIAGIKNMHKNGLERTEIEEKFSGYLSSGHPQIAKENDDKTMLIGVLIS
ncbi:MAG: protein phosphatase 2C domain-containing protein [Bacteroidetes bacterium]|nr:protein phosphatase 2C domain-containing protein [Bacteroidota bacterium]